LRCPKCGETLGLYFVEEKVWYGDIEGDVESGDGEDTVTVELHPEDRWTIFREIRCSADCGFFTEDVHLIDSEYGDDWWEVTIATRNREDS